mgnify:CR=1 FL=1
MMRFMVLHLRSLGFGFAIKLQAKLFVLQQALVTELLALCFITILIQVILQQAQLLLQVNLTKAVLNL